MSSVDDAALHAKFKSLYVLKVRELKELCRKDNLKVGGSKYELAARLCGLKERKTKMSRDAVNKWLKDQGVTHIIGVSRCLRAGIQRGFVDISGKSPLDNIVITGPCCWCDDELKVTIRDLLYQPDYAGHDYDCGSDATVKCTNEWCEAEGVYVTGICNRSTEINCGKGHSHCSECPGFGICFGDYRQGHCMECGDHYYSCNGVFSCHCKPEDAQKPFDWDALGL